MKNIKGTLILLLTAFIWGTAFVAQTSAGDSLGTFTFNTIRNIIAACFLFVFIKLRESVHKEAECKSFPVKEGIVCGIVLCISMTLQQMGINNYPDGVAVSGRAGFLTATYVVMVSVAAVFMGKKLHKLVIISACICIAGMYLLCMSGGIDSKYKNKRHKECCHSDTICRYNVKRSCLYPADYRTEIHKAFRYSNSLKP